MATVLPVVPMRIHKGEHGQIQYRLITYAHPDTGLESHLIQSRVKGSAWGAAVSLERERVS